MQKMMMMMKMRVDEAHFYVRMTVIRNALQYSCFPSEQGTWKGVDRHTKLLIL